MIGRLIGIGNAARQVGSAVGDVAEVFVGNRAEREAADHERYVRSLAQFGEEFTHPGSRWFDGVVNGLNRLPRPMMAIGTLGLFAYSMVEPQGFALRMQGLAYVPDPLWWLLGAVVSFYFGARELHHFRGRKLELPTPVVGSGPPAAGHAVALPLPAPSAYGFSDPSAALSGHDEAGERPVDRTLPAGDPAAAPAGAGQDAVGSTDTPQPVIAVRAADPGFNAAWEEWRAAGR